MSYSIRGVHYPIGCAEDKDQVRHGPSRCPTEVVASPSEKASTSLAVQLDTLLTAIDVDGAGGGLIMTNVAFDPVTKTEGLPRPNSPKTFTSTRPSLTGVSYCNLTVYGFGSATDYQKTFANLPLTLCNEVSNTLSRVLGRRRFRKSRIDILREFEGLIPNGEMLLVLGRPGSGCSTLLKTLAGQTQGLNIQEGARINYQGIRFFIGWLWYPWKRRLIEGLRRTSARDDTDEL